MSSEKDGWISTVRKMFAIDQNQSRDLTEQKEIEMQEDTSVEKTLPSVGFIPNGSSSYSVMSRSLRYLSPSALERGFSKPGVSKPLPTEDIFASSATSTRKRVLKQDERPASAIDGFFNHDNPKRCRKENFGHSMMSSRILDDLDSPWLDRTMEGSSSCVDFAHSHSSSNRSLLGRIGSNRSNSSSLSSKTKAILSHLERINTPAREACKLPVMRGFTVPSERWAPLHIGTPPPLIRSSATVPSRIQLLSSSLASQRKPYWRDMTRKVQEEGTGIAEKKSGTTDCSSVHPLFNIEDGSEFSQSVLPKKKDLEEVVSKVSEKISRAAEKGGKEKSGISCNVFSVRRIFEENEIDGGFENDIDKPVFAPPTKAAPCAKFDDDLIFSFAAPIERSPGQNVVFQAEAGGRAENESEDEQSDDNELEDGQSSSTLDADEAATLIKDSSRPPTAANSETSAVVSSSITPTSSNDVSPQTKLATSWECPDCFIRNNNVNICAACGHHKDALNVTKALVSNISSFGKPTTASTIRFGITTKKASNDSLDKPGDVDLPPTKTVAFGLKINDSKTTDALKPEQQQSDAPQKSSLATLPPANAAKQRESEKESRPWECPECMVQNKATDNKCVCCGHVMCKTSLESSSTNVFGDRAFKPASNAKFSFGFNGGSSDSNSGAAVQFGFGTNAMKEPSAAKENIGAIPSAPQSTKTIMTSEAASSPLPEKDAHTALLKTVSSPCFGITVLKSEDLKPQTSISTLGAGSALFGAGAKPPLFGTSSASLFNTSSSTNSFLTTCASAQPLAALASISEPSQAASTSAPASFTFDAAPIISFSKPFGLPGIKDEVKAPSNKVSTFGSGISFGSCSNPPAQLCATTTVALSSATTTTTSKGSTMTSGPFGTQANKPSFPVFGNTTIAQKPLFGNPSSTAADASKAPLFGVSHPSSEASKQLFGASASDPANKPVFGVAAVASAPATNGGLGFNFGSSNAFGSFGTPSSTSAAGPSLSSNSSTTSLFGNVQQDAAKPFQFNPTIPESAFQFGQVPLAGSTPFQFGSAQPAAPAMLSFGSTSITAPPVPSSNFAFTSSSGPRKMVSARRRLPQRK